jgi:hypothetical protein
MTWKRRDLGSLVQSGEYLFWSQAIIILCLNCSKRWNIHTKMFPISRFPKTKCLNRLGWVKHRCAQQGKLIGICLRHDILQKYSNFSFLRYLRDTTKTKHIKQCQVYARLQNRWENLALAKAYLSFCLSVRPYGRTRLPLAGFSWNPMLGIF